MNSFDALPPVGAWRLVGAYEGHEVVRFGTKDGGISVRGTTVGVEEGVPWGIHYAVEVSSDWRVRRATVADHTGLHVQIRTDETGSWLVNGVHRPELDGCLDVDLEASVVTNTLPVHRLRLSVGQRGESAAAYVRTVGLAVERLDQSYQRLPDVDGRMLFDYQSPRFGYRDILRFGPDGLATQYPGIGERIPLSPRGPATERT